MFRQNMRHEFKWKAACKSSSIPFFDENQLKSYKQHELFELFRCGPEATVDKMKAITNIFIQMSIIHECFVSLSLIVFEISWEQNLLLTVKYIIASYSKLSLPGRLILPILTKYDSLNMGYIVLASRSIIFKL